MVITCLINRPLWTFNHGQLPPNTEIFIQSDDITFLTIFSAGFENSGYYECRNLNDKTRAEVTIIGYTNN